jgi:hypothetical protein
LDISYTLFDGFCSLDNRSNFAEVGKRAPR